MKRLAWIAAILLLLLAACGPGPGTPEAGTETLVPSATIQDEQPMATTSTVSPTSPLPTETGTLTATPERTATPTVLLPTLSQPTLTLSIIPQPNPASAAIQFHAPGPMSLVTSPLRFWGYAVPGAYQQGLVELYGEDGTILASELLRLYTDYKWAFFQWELDFQPRGAGELGRLSLSTRDTDGRLTAVQSVHLLLLPEGLEMINPPDSLAERCILSSPPAGRRVSGGMVAVSGTMQPHNSLPLIVDLVDRQGDSLGSLLVPVPPGGAGRPMSFEVEIPYDVRSSTEVLLTVRQADDRIGGTMYLFSQEIFLNP